MRKRISIILPVFNEKDRLEKTVLSVLELQKSYSDYLFEIIISDSRSTDGTTEIAKGLSRRFQNVHSIVVGPGLGEGLFRGHEYAITKLKPDVLVQVDADGQVDIKVIPLLIGAIEKGNDLALGSRFVSGGENRLPTLRRVFSLGSSIICRVIMGPGDITEFTNSARAFTPRLFKKINWKKLPLSKKTFIFMPAFINEAVLAGATYTEVPLIFKDRDVGDSKNRVLSYTLDLIIYACAARLRKWGIIKE